MPTLDPNSGCRRAGQRFAKRVGRRRFTGPAIRHRPPDGASTPCAALSRCRSRAALPKRPSATSASSRPMPSPAGWGVVSPRSLNGSTPPRRRASPRPPTSSRPEPFTPSRPPAASSLATPGSGPPRPTPDTPATSRFRARWASTTASSCRRRSSCAAAPA